MADYFHDEVNLADDLGFPHCRHQLSYPNCWACATTDAVLAVFLQEGWPVPTRFSPQDLVNHVLPNVELDPDDNGAYPLPAHYIVVNYVNANGVLPAFGVPYVGPRQEPPNERPQEEIYHDVRFLPHDENDDEGIMYVLRELRRPVLAGVNPPPGYLLATDLFHGENIGRSRHLHSILIVGYGTDLRMNVRYWLIRNSSGPEFCNNGYYRMRMRSSVHGQPLIKEAFYPVPVDDDDSMEE